MTEAQREPDNLSIPEQIASCIQQIEIDLSVITQDSQQALLKAQEKQNNMLNLAARFDELKNEVSAYRNNLA